MIDTVGSTVDAVSFTEPLTMPMDPRVKDAVGNLQAQFDLEIKIPAAMQRDFAALTQVRNLRARLKELLQPGGHNVQFALTDLDKRVAEVEGAEGGYGASFLNGPSGRGLVRLNQGLNNLLGVADSADAAPTTQAVAMFDDVAKALDEQLAGWAEIQKKDLPALNAALKQAGIPQIDLNSRARIDAPANH